MPLTLMNKRRIIESISFLFDKAYLLQDCAADDEKTTFNLRLLAQAMDISRYSKIYSEVEIDSQKTKTYQVHHFLFNLMQLNAADAGSLYNQTHEDKSFYGKGGFYERMQEAQKLLDENKYDDKKQFEILKDFFSKDDAEVFVDHFLEASKLHENWIKFFNLISSNADKVYQEKDIFSKDYSGKIYKASTKISYAQKAKDFGFIDNLKDHSSFKRYFRDLFEYCILDINRARAEAMEEFNKKVAKLNKEELGEDGYNVAIRKIISEYHSQIAKEMATKLSRFTIEGEQVIANDEYGAIYVKHEDGVYVDEDDPKNILTAEQIEEKLKNKELLAPLDLTTELVSNHFTAYHLIRRYKNDLFNSNLFDQKIINNLFKPNALEKISCPEKLDMSNAYFFAKENCVTNDLIEGANGKSEQSKDGLEIFPKLKEWLSGSELKSIIESLNKEEALRITPNPSPANSHRRPPETYKNEFGTNVRKISDNDSGSSESRPPSPALFGEPPSATLEIERSNSQSSNMSLSSEGPNRLAG